MIRSGPSSSISSIALPSQDAGPDPLYRRFGPPLGAGDAIWRALPGAGDIVCVAGRERLDAALVDRLTQPLLEDPEVLLVNGVYTPASRGDARSGDRLLEIVARPLVRVYEPALAELEQPMAYEFAARRSLLTSLAFPVGAGVHLSLLIDTVRAHGRGAVHEVALHRYPEDDRPLRTLGVDASALISAVRRRVGGEAGAPTERLMMPWDDLAAVYVETAERPPLDHLVSGSDVKDRCAGVEPA